MASLGVFPGSEIQGEILNGFSNMLELLNVQHFLPKNETLLSKNV